MEIVNIIEDNILSSISEIVGVPTSQIIISRQYVDKDNCDAGDYYTVENNISDTPFHNMVYAVWFMKPMPGCCGIVISTGVTVNYAFQKRGLGTILNKLRITIAKDLGYGCMMCTDVTTNIAQSKILDKNGWSKLSSFINPRTNNVVNIHAINL